MDALLPPQMAEKAEAIGVAKARLPALQTVLLAVLAGAFIALGAVFSVSVVAGSTLPYGLNRLVAGAVFSVGLVLVVVAGAELFTGNNLVVMARMSGRIGTAALARNWSLVYLGNTLGALGTVLLVLLGQVHTFGGGTVGAVVLATAAGKCALEPLQALALGVLCNALVCLAVWMTFSARTTADKVLVVVPPVAAFVASGFEHSIANLFFVPWALALQAFDPAFVQAAGGPAATLGAFLGRNLIPVTLGNMIGGGVLVGAVYHVVYLRGRR